MTETPAQSMYTFGRSIVVAAVAFSAMISAIAPASAVSLRVKIACSSDYHAHCSQHRPGSEGVRQCMRAIGDKLSKRCVNALLHDGEVSSAEVDGRRDRARTAQR